MTLIDDFDGDKRSEIAVVNRAGLTILKRSASSLGPVVIAPNGTRFGGWLLNTADNQFNFNADLDGDGCCELFVSSPRGIGVLKQSGSAIAAPFMAPNGTRFGAWLLNTADNRFGPAGDFDGDGTAEMFIASPWGIAVLKLSGGTFQTVMMAPNGTRFGGWLLNTNDNRFGPVGDFDGDGRVEILISSPWGIGLLKLSGATLTVPFMTPNGTRFGGWLLNTADNLFSTFADVDGDGRAELLVTSPWGLGLLKFVSAVAPAIIADAFIMMPNGTRIGGWLLNTLDHRVGAVVDRHGDRREGFLLSGPSGIGFFEVINKQATVDVMCSNGARLGEWLVNVTDNEFNVSGDYDGDGRGEVVVTSASGLGILDVANKTVNAGSLLRWQDGPFPGNNYRPESRALSLAASPPEGGRVDGDGLYHPGVQLSARAYPNPGWAFRCWTEAGIEVSTQPEAFLVTMDRDHTYVATFERSQNPINGTRATALEIAVGYRAEFNTAGAPADDGEAPIANCMGCGAPLIGKTLWFRFAPTVTGNYGVICETTAFDLVFAVYRGDELMGCGWMAFQGVEGEVQTAAGGWFALQAGLSYDIRIGGASGASGIFTLNLKSM